MKFLITGAKGQLARELIKYFEKYTLEFVAFSKEELDVTDFNKIYKEAMDKATHSLRP